MKDFAVFVAKKIFTYNVLYAKIGIKKPYMQYTSLNERIVKR